MAIVLGDVDLDHADGRAVSVTLANTWKRASPPASPCSIAVWRSGGGWPGRPRRARTVTASSPAPTGKQKYVKLTAACSARPVAA